MNSAVYKALLVAALLVLPTRMAFACVCYADEGPAAAFKAADAVFLARVVSITNRTEMLQSKRSPAVKPVVEEAELVVEKVWKNARVGERIVFRSPQNTSCSRTFTERVADTTNEPNGRWIVYAHGQQPYVLIACDRSHPLTLPASPNDEQVLDKLVRRK